MRNSRAYSNTRCTDGRLMRHDPQRDDPYLETDIGQCPECDGHGCDLPHKIITTHVYPPIPDRRWDWQAIYDNDEPNDDGQMAVGHGPTEATAINDLVENYPRD